MAKRQKKASLSRSQGRSGWSVIFRHPVLCDASTGKPGRRIRRGLGTRDKPEASRLANELTQLLQDSTLWEPSARSEAARRFDSKVVDIFYDKMIPENVDFRDIRDELIPLPSSDSDYRRVLLLGTTGAGKTTLVRQLIGTDPRTERFPSTSTAKTTIHDTEILLDNGPAYRAVVTFASSDEVRDHLTECVSAAILEAHYASSDAEILRKLLNHVDQRFRFNYVLGNGPVEDFDDFDDEDMDDNPHQETDPSDIGDTPDLQATNQLLTSVLSELKAIAARLWQKLRKDLEATGEGDQRVLAEIFEEELDHLLREDDAFHHVTDRLLDEIELRFDFLELGELTRTRSRWPLSWRWESTDRKEFLKAIARFSSNYAPLFGSLLAPLVNGLRVAGPFAPSWLTETDHQPQLVLLDGEGLGHTPRSSTTISTAVTRLIEQSDAVLLVDSSKQPMQAAAIAAMRELVSSGNTSKLIIAFTHFDSVTGDNLPSASSRAKHVLASAAPVLRSLGEDLGPFAERALRQRIDKNRFFLASIHQPLDINTATGHRTVTQLRKMLQTFVEVVERPEQGPVRPIYDRMQLAINVKKAAENYHDAWFPILGLTVRPGISKEHWTRIKALSRRLATPGWTDEYDTLKPVADLRKQLLDQIYLMIQNPLRWNTQEPDDDEKQLVYEQFAAAVSTQLLDLASKRVHHSRNKEWRNAYDLRGRGSTFVRARIIGNNILEEAAPIPDTIPSPTRGEFLRDVYAVLEETAQETGVILE